MVLHLDIKLLIFKWSLVSEALDSIWNKITTVLYDTISVAGSS